MELTEQFRFTTGTCEMMALGPDVCSNPCVAVGGAFAYSRAPIVLRVSFTHICCL